MKKISILPLIAAALLVSTASFASEKKTWNVKEDLEGYTGFSSAKAMFEKGPKESSTAYSSAGSTGDFVQFGSEEKLDANTQRMEKTIYYAAEGRYISKEELAEIKAKKKKSSTDKGKAEKKETPVILKAKVKPQAEKEDLVYHADFPKNGGWGTKSEIKTYLKNMRFNK